MFSSVDLEAAHARLEQLQELEDFTEMCKKHLEKIFTELGWNWRETEEELVECPIDPAHKVPLRSLNKHKESCLLKKMDYSNEEQEEMVDTTFCYENSSVRTFVMDKETQQQVIAQARSSAPLMKMEGVFWQGQFSSEAVDVPQNHKRALCDLTVADRLALYDHVVSKLSNHNEAAPSNEDLYVDLVKKLQREEEQNEPKTHLELMAEKRDYKRRRQSYRAKNVHITKKSYTEVIREVISVHSEELSRQWKEEESERRRHTDRSRNHHNKHDRDRERDKERDYERDHERDRERDQDKDHHRDHERDKESKASYERDYDGSREQSLDRSSERDRDGEHRKKKKKRQRDSRSPDEHHERKKKKKKRKREGSSEREKKADREREREEWREIEERDET